MKYRTSNILILPRNNRRNLRLVYDTVFIVALYQISLFHSKREKRVFTSYTIGWNGNYRVRVNSKSFHHRNSTSFTEKPYMEKRMHLLWIWYKKKSLFALYLLGLREVYRGNLLDTILSYFKIKRQARLMRKLSLRCGSHRLSWHFQKRTEERHCSTTRIQIKQIKLTWSMCKIFQIRSSSAKARFTCIGSLVAMQQHDYIRRPCIDLESQANVT